MSKYDDYSYKECVHSMNNKNRLIDNCEENIKHNEFFSFELTSNNYMARTSSCRLDDLDVMDVEEYLRKIIISRNQKVIFELKQDIVYLKSRIKELNK